MRASPTRVGAILLLVVSDRRPAALLPAPLARTLGFALLALLGAAEWRRMLDAPGLAGTAGWVAAGVLAGELVGAAAEYRGRRRAAAAVLAASGGLVLASLASGLEPRLLAPANWPELTDGIARGLEALSGVTLPYRGADPWPGITVGLGGALLVTAAATLAAWPRRESRGFPFVALAVLLVLVITPVAALGSSRSLGLGLGLAGLTVCFLWLERLPLRPGAGVAVLGGLALAGSLPLGAAANREEPWFDYRSFAEGVGTPAAVRFDWEHSYGPLTWKREGREMLRIVSDRPQYWKVENLEDFDGERWVPRGTPDAFGPEPEADLDRGSAAHPEWSGSARISVRGLRGSGFVGAGTTTSVDAGRLRALSTFSPGTWEAERELRSGDSYEIHYHAPRPEPGQLASATSGADGEQADALELALPLTVPLPPRDAEGRNRPVGYAKLVLRPFAERADPVAEYERRGISASGVVALRNSPYWRTWLLAQRLKKGASSPYEYARRIDAYLARGFRYDESPAPPRPGQVPLDAFLFDTRAGYCQHFSGAMALLLRLGGVPARVGAGFSPGGYKRRQGEWVIRDRDAHSWVEAWFDGIGWVTLDPTPSATPARSLIAAIRDDPEPSAAAATDSTGGAGGGAGGGPRNPAGARRELDPAAKQAAASAPGAGATPWEAILAGAALVLALAAGAVVLARRHRQEGSRAPDERALADLLRALRRAGRPVTPPTTLSALERRLGSSRGGAAYVSAVRAARYGPSGAEPTERERRAFRTELAAGLGWRGALRAWWAVPPRLGRRSR